MLILLGVFFATLPISMILNALFPWGIRISDALVRLGVYWVDAAEIAYLLATILTSLFFTLIAWLFLSVEINSKAQVS